MAQDLLISGVIDGPLSGGIPKAVEIYVINNVADLSSCGLGSANNGGGSEGEEFTFPAVAASAGSYIYVASESVGFNNFFGFSPDYTSGAASINGDDAIELFCSSSVIDVFGDINTDGTGQPWEYLDGWAYRNDNTGPDGSAFTLASWSFSGPNALDGESSNGAAATPFPIGTYTTTGAPDSAPIVTSTVPANGATGVGLSDNITVNFSEDVNVAGSWFDINCTVSGNKTAVFGGGPQSFLIDPDINFVADEDCTVDIFAAQVNDVDSDDPPDNMAADFQFSFDTNVFVAPDLVINEFQADPASGLDGDANGDGIRDSSDDEFVELVNAGVGDLDISGWTLADGFSVRHTFPSGSVIAQGCSLIVFGGGTLTGSFGGGVAQTASGGSLGLNNGGDSITLNNGVIDVLSVSYGSEGGDNQSLTLDPDVTGALPYVKHTTATGSGGTRFSPGTKIDGTRFDGCPTGIVINEFQADPAGDISGDANGDGVRDSGDDEFVEIANNSGSDVDMSGWTVSDAVGVRHTFPSGSVVLNGCSVVVFGGGTPTGAFGYSLVQTASGGSLGLNNGGDTITINNGVQDMASLGYGGEGGDNQSLTRDPDVTGTDPLVKHSLATGSGGALFSPGTTIDGTPFTGCPAPLPITPIHDIQGPGSSSPLVGQIVAIEGIVVGDFQDGVSGTNGDLNGFYVQEEDADVDADPSTSEGIFIYNGSSPAVDVQIGDFVRVEGAVSEFSDITEITSFTGVSVISSGNPLPNAAVLSLPVSSLMDFEAVEGMAVTFPQALVISEYFQFGRYNEIALTSRRYLSPTAEFEPGADAIQAAADFLLDRIMMDDGRTSSNPDPAIHPNGAVFDLDNLFRGGDTVQNLTGVMDYARSMYRIQPTHTADYVSVNPRTTEPELTGGDFKVASFNVLNYFNGDGLGGGFPTSRGADNAAEFTRQRDKIIAAMVAIDADVFGLMEIENDGYDTNSAIQDLVNGLNDATAPDTYAFVDPGVPMIGTDEIAVGFIYNETTVATQGSSAILDSSVDPDFNDFKNRPALAQTFIDGASGGVLTVVVNHLKSKGSDCDSIGDPDTGDGSGNCNLTRASAAAALVDWLAIDPTGSNDSDTLIIGDLNAYDKEDPIVILTDGGYTDLEFIFNGEDAYSYVFNGQTGYLDYALASPGLFAQFVDVTAWHINADEPNLIDYDTDFKQPAQDEIYAADPYRSSDHDPIIGGIDLLHYGFTGFFKPIDNLPEINRAKAGSGIPVKFSLNSDYGLDILVDGYPKTQEIDCDSGDPLGDSEETETAGDSSLSYDPEDDQYIYVWKSSKSWKGSCHQLTVQLTDGSIHRANFQFR